MGECMGEWRNILEANKCQGEHKKPHSHTLESLGKVGIGLQLMHSMKCQDVQTRAPQLQLMCQNHLFTSIDQYNLS